MLNNPWGELLSQVLEVLPLYMKLEAQCIWGEEKKRTGVFHFSFSVSNAHCINASLECSLAKL